MLPHLLPSFLSLLKFHNNGVLQQALTHPPLLFFLLLFFHIISPYTFPSVLYPSLPPSLLPYYTPCFDFFSSLFLPPPLFSCVTLFLFIFPLLSFCLSVCLFICLPVFLLAFLPYFFVHLVSLPPYLHLLLSFPPWFLFPHSYSFFLPPPPFLTHSFSPYLHLSLPPFYSLTPPSYTMTPYFLCLPFTLAKVLSRPRTLAEWMRASSLGKYEPR